MLSWIKNDEMNILTEKTILIWYLLF